MYPGSAGFRGADRNRLSREVDRTTWAGDDREVIVWETKGTGTVFTPQLRFKRVFEGQPSFSFGAEVGDDTPVVAGDYPFLSAGVAEWDIVQANVEGRASFYRSAVVWLTVAATTAYTLRWTFTFSGTAMRNREYLGG